MPNKHPAIILVALLGVSAAISASAATIQLTGAPWDLEGFDNGGNVFGGTTLVFETQVLNGTDYDLTGYIDWVGAGPQCPVGCTGRELFTGKLFSDSSLELNGFEVIDPVQIVASSYSAIALDSLTIVDGIWGPLNDPVIPGEWSASRAVVPLPAALPMFLSGLAGILAMSLRRPSRHGRIGTAS